MSHRIFVGVGSNIDREKNIKSCMKILKGIYGDIMTSPVYETSLWVLMVLTSIT